MTYLTLIILSAGVWRISDLLVTEKGFFGILTDIRSFVAYIDGLQQKLLSNIFEEPRSINPLTCVWCTSVWIGILVTILYVTIPVYTSWIMLPFALSALAILIDRYSQ